MKTSVNLQAPFSYSIWPLVILGALSALFFICIIVFIVMKKIKSRPKKPEVKELTERDIKKLKKKYLKLLSNIENKLIDKSILPREAYQKMSECIRMFVYEVTGIKVQNYTLQEIKLLSMNELEDLIAEYYVPEFSMDSADDSMAALKRTKSAIENWNKREYIE